MLITLAGCATSVPSPDPSPPVTTVVAPPAPPVVTAAPAATAVSTPTAVEPVVPVPPIDTASAKEAPLVQLPDYARRGKRLAADGGAPGRAVTDFCRGFEVEKDAQSYFRRLQRTQRLPSAAEVAERNRATGQSLTIQQYVERDWALRRDNNRSAPQRCRVLGGSVDGASATVVFEADLNGKRQRGTASVTQTNGKWRVRDHGDWAAVNGK
jgi:hypothetical protein